MRTCSLTDVEVERLLVPPADEDDVRAVRAQLAVSLMAEAGWAAAQVRALSISEAVRHQLGRAGTPLPERTRERLAAALAAFVGRPMLFAPGSEPLSAPALHATLVRFGRSRGVERVTPERLRRTYARRALASGTPEVALAAELGYQDVRWLRRWMRADPLHASARAKTAGSARAALNGTDAHTRDTVIVAIRHTGVGQPVAHLRWQGIVRPGVDGR